MLTFRQFLLEQDERPKVEYKPPRRGSNDHIFKVTHSLLTGPKHVSIRIDHRSPNHGTMNVYPIHDLQQLGTRHVMHVLGRIKHHLPHIETLGGDRVTGSRTGTSRENQHTETTVKNVKPIPPDKE